MSVIAWYPIVSKAIANWRMRKSARVFLENFWNVSGLEPVAAHQVPQPEIHLRTDGEPAYRHVARIIADASRVGLVKPDFVTGPFNASVLNPSCMQPARPRLPASACSRLQALADTAIQP